MPADVRVHSDRKDELVFLAVEIVELVAPKLFYIFRVHPAMAVGCFLDEHHARIQWLHVSLSTTQTINPRSSRQSSSESSSASKSLLTVEGHRDTSSRESRLALSSCRLQVASSRHRGACHSRSGPTCRLSGASKPGNHGGRRSGHIQGRSGA